VKRTLTKPASGASRPPHLDIRARLVRLGAGRDPEACNYPRENPYFPSRAFLEKRRRLVARGLRQYFGAGMAAAGDEPSAKCFASRTLTNSL
jgi:hypothetical protein